MVSEDERWECSDRGEVSRESRERKGSEERRECSGRGEVGCGCCVQHKP